uniref:BTB domain-containing protein n=1 Tax=Craspedostauros australis TaxID=1486917 RepID=A0A7R9WS82_9STRA|mmetsp:Transcript_15181/g.41981  ORF Transcript_15181/g.41981 Transcript_15181/m.41981 type:complete len:142 (+) Transcript_15181:506-931(+)
MTRWSHVGRFHGDDADDNDDDGTMSDDSSDAGTSVTFWSRESLGEQPLTWRMDPETSFSDWVIEVHSAPLHEHHTYHVHRAIVGIGARRSVYFANIFYAEMGGGYGTRLRLDPESRKYFPALLDYCTEMKNFASPRRMQWR